MVDAVFECSYAKLATSSCRKCKQKIEKGALRLAKLVSNPYSSAGGDMKQYHHPKCLFDSFVKARATTKIITEPDDIRGYDDLLEEDQQVLNDLIEELVAKKSGKKTGTTPKKPPTPRKPQTSKGGNEDAIKPSTSRPPPPMKKPVPKRRDDDFIDDSDDDEHYVSPVSNTASVPTAVPRVIAAVPHSNSSFGSAAGLGADASTRKNIPGAGVSLETLEKDNSFREFRKLCANIAEESSYTGKTKILATFLEKGTTGVGFKGDVFLLLKLLLPGVIKYVYNLHDKQLVKCFSQIFDTDLDEMVEDLEQGDVAETIALFFDKSKGLKPSKKSLLSLQEVDNMLADLAERTKEDEQSECLRGIAKQCTTNDLKMIVRLIKHDLRINAGAKHVLDALDPNAYEAFQASRDLRDVVNRVTKRNNLVAGASAVKGEMTKALSIKAQLMTPIQPMLAEACRSVDQAFSRCPNGMYAEIKYDGERVQLHKQGSSIKYFSRSLKPVQAHKVQHFQEYLKQAFPEGNDLILDCEVLLIDTKTSKPLPFGTLGVHKKAAFKDANVCLFVFDCIHLNGTSLMDRPIKERRKVLMESMTEIPNRIMFSEVQHIKHKDVNALTDLLTKVFTEGLEGLVLKDMNGTYEPGKRHWLKVKKDYLAEGTMADSADLVVLGAYYGSGSKGGMMSIFLMGCYDPENFRWCTVTKCGNGLDDKLIKRLNRQLEVEKIGKDPNKVPQWLHVTKTLVPDFVVKNPKKSQVWEITGAEFSSSNVHTAKGISIRFPRLSKVREDKAVKDATDLHQLLKLYASSRRKSDIPGLLEKKKRSRQEDRDEDDDEEELFDNNKDNDDDDDEDERATDDEFVSEVNENEASSFSQLLGKQKVNNSSSSMADNGVSPVKRAKIDDSGEPPLPVCRYGASCYQTNPEHRKKFSHPEPLTTKPKAATIHTDAAATAARPSSTAATACSGPLVDIFTGCKFLVPSTIDERTNWVRYIIAYDGDVLQDHEAGLATHVIVPSNDKGKSKASSAQHVTVAWLAECIKKKKLIKL
jgi:DNA ligase-3